MCFIVHPKHKEAKVASRNIPCYKHLVRISEDITISPWAYYPYELNKTNPRVKLKIENDSIINTIINKGYHVYSSKQSLKKIFICDIAFLFKCTIPKGTKYYYNPERKEYVSEQIIINHRL